MSPPLRPPVLVVLLVFSLILSTSEASGGSGDDPLEGLPAKVGDQMRSKLPGVVLARDDTVAPIARPEDWLPFERAAFDFDRPGSDRSATWTLSPATRVPGAGRDSKAKGWTIVQSNGSTRFIEALPSGAIESRCTVNSPNAVIIDLEPAEPVIGRPGEVKVSSSIEISVRDLGSPADVQYSGTVSCIWRAHGGFKVRVPAGEFGARLLSVEFDGSVGPASVGGVRLLLVAPKVGPVAFSDDRDISAFLFFNDDTKNAGVLRKIRRGE